MSEVEKFDQVVDKIKGSVAGYWRVFSPLQKWIDVRVTALSSLEVRELVLTFMKYLFLGTLAVLVKGIFYPWFICLVLARDALTVLWKHKVSAVAWICLALANLHTGVRYIQDRFAYIVAHCEGLKPETWWCAMLEQISVDWRLGNMMTPNWGGSLVDLYSDFARDAGREPQRYIMTVLKLYVCVAGLLGASMSLYNFSSWLGMYGASVPQEELLEGKVISLSQGKEVLLRDPKNVNEFKKAIKVGNTYYVDLPIANQTKKAPGFVGEMMIEGSPPIMAAGEYPFSFTVKNISGAILGGGFRVDENIFFTAHQLRKYEKDLSKVKICTKRGECLLTKEAFEMVDWETDDEMGGDWVIMKPKPFVFAQLALASGRWLLRKGGLASMRWCDSNFDFYNTTGFLEHEFSTVKPSMRWHNVSTQPGCSGRPLANPQGILGMHNGSIEQSGKNLYTPASVLVSRLKSLKQKIEQVAPQGEGGEPSYPDDSSRDDVDDFDYWRGKMRGKIGKGVDDDDQPVGGKQKRQPSEAALSAQERRAGINTGGVYNGDSNVGPPAMAVSTTSVVGAPVTDVPAVPVPVNVVADFPKGSKASGTSPEQLSPSSNDVSLKLLDTLRVMQEKMDKQEKILSKISASSVVAPSQPESGEAPVKKPPTKSAVKRAKRILKATSQPTLVSKDVTKASDTLSTGSKES
jgi:hypothetical protein